MNAETPRQRLARLDREWDRLSDAAHLLWAYDTPTPANAAQIRAECDRVTVERRLALEEVRI